jgi:hypothetical protein
MGEQGDVAWALLVFAQQAVPFEFEEEKDGKGGRFL